MIDIKVRKLMIDIKSYIKQSHATQLKIFLMLCSVLLFSIPTFAQFTFTDDLKGIQPADFVLGAQSGSDLPYFTSGVDDPVGAGWLRLTRAARQQNGYAYIDKSFPSTHGVVVEFEYKMWRQSNYDSGFWGLGGDGFTFFLFDADYTPFRLGAFGGSLGYAQRWGDSNHPNQHGLGGGYIGVGFDMFGYFATATEGKIGGLPSDPINQFDRIPNTVSLRGITTDSPTTTSNIFLDGIKLGDRSLAPMQQVQQPGLIGYPSLTSTRPTDAQMYRRVQIRVNPLPEGGYEVRVAWKKSNTPGPFEQLITYIYTEAPPANLKLGFAGASNSAINNHEMRGLKVTTPNNLRVNKLANKDLLRSVPSTNNANQITYTIEVVNESDQAYTNAAFLDEMVDLNGDPISTDMFDITNISPTGFTNTNLAQVAGQNTISGTVSIAANTTAYVQVTGSLNQIPYNNQLINNVSVLPAAGGEDFDLTNNYASLTIPVIAEDVDLTLIRTATSSECLDYTNGNSYELRVANLGALNATYRRPRGNGNRIVVIKEVPAEYTYDDSGTSFSTSPTNTGSTRWYKATENIPSGYTGYGDVEFPTGGTRYYYVAKYPTSSWTNQSLTGHGTFYEPDFPIIYTITPPNNVTAYQDVARVEYRTGGTNSSYDLGTTNIEQPENLHNNTRIGEIAALDSVPEVMDGNEVYYYVGDIASPLTATPDSGNTLIWYLSEQGGVPQTIAPTPFTFEEGTTRYWVSQTNGYCESPRTYIDVVVQPRTNKLITNPMIRQRMKN